MTAGAVAGGFDRVERDQVAAANGDGDRSLLDGLPQKLGKGTDYQGALAAGRLAIDDDIDLTLATEGKIAAHAAESVSLHAGTL